MELIKKEIDSASSEQLNAFHACVSELVKPVSERYVYHYTTIESLFHGLLCDSKKQICLWASNALYMNDTKEIQTGCEFMYHLLEDNFVEINDEKGLDNLKDVVSDYFLSSFSLRRDSLSMWRMYAKNATGVSLCFDVDLLRENTRGEFLKSVYLTEDIEQSIRDCLREVNVKKISQDEILIILIVSLIALSKDDNKEEVLARLYPYMRLVTALKHKAYVDEDEVRLVLVAGEADRKFRFKDNKFIPYIEQYFPKEALTEIIVGPNNDMPRTVYSLETYLKHIGFDHVKVTASDIPYKD